MFEHTYMHMYIHNHKEATKPIIVIYTFRVFVVHITKTKTTVGMPFCYFMVWKGRGIFIMRYLSTTKSKTQFSIIY